MKVYQPYHVPSDISEPQKILNLSAGGKGYKTLEEAREALGRMIVTEEVFEEVYQLMVNVKNKTHLRRLGEELNIPNFVERCASKRFETWVKEFSGDFIDQVMEGIHPENRIQFKPEDLKHIYYIYKSYNHPNLGSIEIETRIENGDENSELRVVDIRRYICFKVSDLLKTSYAEFSNLNRELVKEWEEKLEGIENYHQFKEKYYHNEIKNFSEWTDGYYGVREIEIS